MHTSVRPLEGSPGSGASHLGPIGYVNEPAFCPHDFEHEDGDGSSVFGGFDEHLPGTTASRMDDAPAALKANLEAIKWVLYWSFKPLMSWIVRGGVVLLIGGGCLAFIRDRGVFPHHGRNCV